MNEDNSNLDSSEKRGKPRRKLKLPTSGARRVKTKNEASIKKATSTETDRSQIPVQETIDESKETSVIYDPNLAKRKLRLYFLVTLVAGSLIILFQ